ncbi:hypothetical protein BD779DRAFT_141020 [Infundibulicybe gibba]|nr:hypothetical protein BD779DRAFT_141020 [Infundibulicybe gibba]
MYDIHRIFEKEDPPISLTNHLCHQNTKTGRTKYRTTRHTITPDRISLKVHFEKHSIESVEMSRKIYAIRDSFQNIVLSTSRGSHSDTPSSRVMSLTTLVLPSWGKISLLILTRPTSMKLQTN